MILTGVKALFVDTNVLIYSSNTASPWHGPAIRAVRQTLQPGLTRAISTQSLREYFATATRPLADGTLPPSGDVLRDIETFRTSYRILPDTHAVSTRLFQLVATTLVGGRKIHDANIVATMVTYGITHLLTHNVADFTRFAALITVVPLEQLGR